MFWQQELLGFSWADKCDFKGNDMYSEFKNTIEECAKACANNKGCTHFAFGLDKNCNYKHKFVTKDDAF